MYVYFLRKNLEILYNSLYSNVQISLSIHMINSANIYISIELVLQVVRLPSVITVEASAGHRCHYCRNHISDCFHI